MKASVFKEDYIAIILRELLKGLDYLHGEGKLHRGTSHHPLEVVLPQEERRHSLSCDRDNRGGFGAFVTLSVIGLQRTNSHFSVFFFFLSFYLLMHDFWKPRLQISKVLCACLYASVMQGCHGAKKKPRGGGCATMALDSIDSILFPHAHPF